MRHIHTETSPPPEFFGPDPSLSQPTTEAPLEPSSQRCTHRGILVGYNETEIKRQKVYQVSIFSHLSNSSESMEERAGNRSAVKRGYPEQRALEGVRDPKRTHWGGRRGDGKHDGWPQRIACSTLHTRDDCPVSSGDQPTDYGENGDQASGRNLLHFDLHNIAQTPQLDSGGKREKPGSSPAHSSTASGEEEWPAVAKGCKEHPSPQTALSPEPSNLSSLEKTPCGSRKLSSSSCLAKRKLLHAGKVVADSCSEDESLSLPAKKKRVLLCHPVPTACRSTDAKGAPFWNHLLPMAKSSADCTAIGRTLKSRLRLKLQHLRSSVQRGTKSSAAPWATTTVSHALLGNFEESILKGRFAPSGRIEGFTAEIGASGSYCPQHATLPVDVTYFDISEHSAPSPFLGVIDLEALGKKGYSVPKAGTIQVTLFNPNKTVVKMFLVTYDFQDMPANHMTFLRHRIFLMPVGREDGATVAPSNCPGTGPPRRVLCYLMHLRFHSSKSGKIYLHNDIRLLFSRKSIEVDSGIPYELKSFTEMPKNPRYSPRA
ncbi:PREDICTED: protein FAM214B [Phaethon lepturus]|nr:PREDICTED: protein FAM214B [Phaethon lepturus]